MTKMNWSKKPIYEHRIPVRRKPMSNKQMVCLKRIKLKQQDPSYELNDWEKKFLLSIDKQKERYING